ncbi:MAG: hypothetical protein IPG75_16920 [Gemmatimonadetes bacterium]|nr:hypothetical protein [Gemmatimonadota bacterium]
MGIDIHWRWYHPLRNRYGFVMLLGHGAVVRREVWEEVGGFPEIVSEDLAFSLRARQHGWHGGVRRRTLIYYEEFPGDHPRLPGAAHEVDPGHLRVLCAGDVAGAALRQGAAGGEA